VMHRHAVIPRSCGIIPIYAGGDWPSGHCRGR
jgi:hypothetical protein